tara:strand:+ start:543 stop:1295 length:753 start_codon:yes stop_codon:yes gene_type:complete
MQLDIILRTHDQKSVHYRSIEYAKKDITQTCANSLYKAIDGIDEVNLITVDDHSSAETVSMLRNVTHLEGTGNNASLAKVFELAADSKADLVYLVEDDYLHYSNAITEMLLTYNKFAEKSNTKDICLSLVDCPANYHGMSYTGGGTGRDGSIARIVGGVNYPWRTVTHTGGTFCTTPNVINKYWGAFDDLVQHWPNVTENDSWNKIWEQHIITFSPLRPLAYHLSEVHPYYPYDELWVENEISSKLQVAA